MKQEQKVRIRTGQCFGRLENQPARKDETELEKDDTEFNKEMERAFAAMTTRVEKKIESAVENLESFIGDRVEKEVGKLLGESMQEKAVVESEVNVTATAALQEEVQAELENKDDEDKAEEVIQKSSKGKNK